MTVKQFRREISQRCIRWDGLKRSEHSVAHLKAAELLANRNLSGFGCGAEKDESGLRMPRLTHML